MTNIDAILRKYKQSPSWEVRPDDQSGWLAAFEAEALAMCAPGAVASGAYFTFIEDRRMQAVSIQDEVEIFGMYAGMFWMLCRLAAAVARSGVFPAMTGDREPSWSPELLRSLQTPRQLLDEATPFDWDAESIGWGQHPQRQMLFFAVLSLLFRFVILHEIGHLHNDHGRRRRPSSSPTVVDRLGPTLLAAEDAIPSQAREIIADNFALRMTIEILERELTQKADLEMTKIIRERLMPDRPALVEFALTIIYLYFRLSDRSDWETLPVERLSHPPAPFRMKGLLASLLEHPPLGLTVEDVRAVIQTVIVAGDALMSVILNVLPNPRWFETISTSEHDRHFARLYEEFPNWSGPTEEAPP